MKRKKNSHNLQKMAAAHTYMKVVKSSTTKYVMTDAIASTINTTFNMLLIVSVFIRLLFNQFGL